MLAFEQDCFLVCFLWQCLADFEPVSVAVLVLLLAAGAAAELELASAANTAMFPKNARANKAGTIFFIFQYLFDVKCLLAHFKVCVEC